MSNENTNPWKPEDEGDHYPVMKEWWTIETLFKTLEDNRKWNFKLIIASKMETTSCFFQYALFDITNKRCVLRKDIDDDIKKLSHEKNKLDLKYGKSTVAGLYPDYNIHIEDEEQGLNFDIKYKAKSLPHWIAHDITNGKVPFGWNYYRYGYIPNCTIDGTLKIKDESYTVGGKGYLEHVWGNWSYQNPFQRLSGVKDTFSTYLKLGKWWLSQHKPRIPHSIEFTTENNIFGYDWAWGVFDNDWSLFYGNVLFWLSRGPAFGILSVTPDGKKYWDFCNINFHYNKLIYVKKYDIYFPSDLELVGVLDDKKIHLRFRLTAESYEYIDEFKNKGFYKAFILSEMPGEVEGLYTDSEKTVKLKGDCKMMPLRQPSSLGHNSLKLDFLLPPKGVGVDIDFDSHYIKRRIKKKIQLAPYPKFKFEVEKLKKEDFFDNE
jgi:hypothetical protein